MSRTYRDSANAKQVRFREQRWENEYYVEEIIAEEYELKDAGGYRYFREYTGTLHVRKLLLQRPGAHPKKKRNEYNRKIYWYKVTPSWWVHDFMTVPKRAKCRTWEKVAAKTKVEDLEDLEICPDHGRKPHLYYW